MRLEHIYWHVFCEGLDSKMAELIKQFTDMPPEEAEKRIREIAEADPTEQKAYTPWLVRQVRKGHLRLPEDQDRALEALRSFEQNKRIANFPGPKDINQYKQFQDFEAVIEKLGGQALKSKRQSKREVKEKGAKLIYDDGTYAVIEVTEPGAAVIYSAGSKWCTSREGTASGYLKNGPLYILFKDDVKFAQMHPASHQLKDLTDRELDYRQDPGLRKIIAKIIKPKDPQSALWMSRVTGTRVPEYEAQIMQNAHTAMEYARDTIGARWPEAEAIIAKDPRAATEYAKEVIKGRWPEAEKWMGVQDMWSAIAYVKDVLKDRWPVLEEALLSAAKNPNDYYGHSNITNYCVAAQMGRWPEGEQKLLEEANPRNLFEYVTKVVGKRWLEAEPIIAQDMDTMLRYAEKFVRGPWPEVEPAVLKSNSDNIFAYINKVLRAPWPRFERAILKSLGKFKPASDEWRDIARLGYKYSRDIKHGQWPELEALLAADPDFAALYHDNMAIWRKRESKQ